MRRRMPSDRVPAWIISSSSARGYAVMDSVLLEGQCSGRAVADGHLGLGPLAVCDLGDAQPDLAALRDLEDLGRLADTHGVALAQVVVDDDAHGLARSAAPVGGDTGLGQ